MGSVAILQKKERLAHISLSAISLIGCWVLIQFGFLKLTEPNQASLLVLIVSFLAIMELYPLPVWKGSTSISFPLVYTIYVMDGLAYALVSLALVSAFVNLVKRRPLRIVIFNPAQRVISLYGAFLISKLLHHFFPIAHDSLVQVGITQVTYLMIPFYMINNLIVDFVLTIRHQVYNFKAWRQKTVQEVRSFIVSYCYLILFVMMENFYRLNEDVISFFFFYTPLLALALLSSIIANLKKEKAKLKALFSISSQLNKKIAEPCWVSFLADNLPEFIDVEACILWEKENEGWKLKYSAGLIKENISSVDESQLDQFDRLKVYHNRKKGAGPVSEYFEKEICSLIYAPLILDTEKVGLFVVGRCRTKSFNEEDMTSAATLANQLAMLIKTRWLFAEQEKKMILEERNRIARDIHDGVAQSLAGAILNLETANRKFLRMPGDAQRLMLESKEKLRSSLREVRESIYALRPYPTERVGLLPAIAAKIEGIQKEYGLPISFEKRGKEVPISPMVEKIIFDIFQESIQNAVKHADAEKIDILISYQKENVFLKVKDNGKGFSLFQAMIKAQKQPHFGILHMNEAAETIQASLQIDSKEDGGTEITLTVPKLGIEGGMMHDQAYASR